MKDSQLHAVRELSPIELDQVSGGGGCCCGAGGVGCGQKHTGVYEVYFDCTGAKHYARAEI